MYLDLHSHYLCIRTKGLHTCRRIYMVINKWSLICLCMCVTELVMAAFAFFFMLLVTNRHFLTFNKNILELLFEGKNLQRKQNQRQGLFAENVKASTQTMKSSRNQSWGCHDIFHLCLCAFFFFFLCDESVKLNLEYSGFCWFDS